MTDHHVEMKRLGCCAGWPKPCPYHEGYQDAYEALQEPIQRTEYVMFDCECCELPRVKEKSKGIGYYCPECFSLCWCEWEDCGREGARFQTTEEFKEAQKRLHAQLEGHG